MEILLETISAERQARFLEPKTSDHFKTFFMGKYGHRIYDIKIGRKWVIMRSNSHRARISLQKYKTLAFIQWRRDVESHTFVPNERRKREWYKDYGFTQKPRDYLVYDKHLSWR
tara:strand:- start:821 stop:1162 length:342 start_codon:yes stop_codon:yes gene_type:complete